MPERRPAGIRRGFWFSVRRGQRLARLESDRRAFIDSLEAVMERYERAMATNWSESLYAHA